MKPVLLCLLAFATALAQADTPATAETPALSFRGFPQPLQLDAAALAQRPRRQVEASDHGTAARWEGADLQELLAAAGAPLGKALRGPNLTRCVLVSAADGYKVIFALAEFDPEFGNNGALLADRRDGKPLDAKEGPFRLILPREQRAGRWVRQVTTIELRDCGQ
jgi:Oxidoreductase molybdopterin binding domain